jgi:nanoRNase/pAp phosphatase (c-di-AMP/oligoRNAs hydrolase)
MKTYNISPIKTLLNGAKTAFIAVPAASIDSIGSALALALSLQHAGLSVSVFCPQKTDENYSKLSGLDLLSETFNSNDLTISLNYPQESIDSVSYNDNGGRLNLVVKVKPDAAKIEREQIIINNQVSIADINFMFGDEASLGEQANIVEKGNWVLVSPIVANKAWAKASVIDPDAPYSEIMSFLLPSLGLSMEVNVAKNLLIALRVATQSFSINVSPETFEAGALCLRSTQITMPQANAFDNQTPIEKVETSGNLFGNPAPSSVSTV